MTKTKKPMNQWAICGIVILCVATLAILSLLIYKNAQDRKEIAADVEACVAKLNNGEIEWTKTSGMQLAGTLNQYLVKENTDSVSGKIVKGAYYEPKISLVWPKRCKVTYTVKAISAEEFFAYCEKKGIEDYEGMLSEVDSYVNRKMSERTEEVTVLYEKKNGEWVCDYYQYDFINAATGGMLDLYKDYKALSYENLKMLMEVTEDEE